MKAELGGRTCAWAGSQPCGFLVAHLTPYKSSTPINLQPSNKYNECCPLAVQGASDRYLIADKGFRGQTEEGHGVSLYVCTFGVVYLCAGIWV